MKFMRLCLDVAVRTRGKFMAISPDAYRYWVPQD